MNHIEEYRLYKTCAGFKESEVEDTNYSIKLMFKDVHGNISLSERITLEIMKLLLYNNVDYISQGEIIETSENIIKIIKK